MRQEKEDLQNVHGKTESFLKKKQKKTAACAAVQFQMSFIYPALAV